MRAATRPSIVRSSTRGTLLGAALLLALGVTSPVDVNAAPDDAVAAAAGVTPVAALPAPAVTVKPPPTSREFPWVELHGYYRFRPDALVNGHLGQAVAREDKEFDVVTASAVRPPLSLWPSNNEKSQFKDKVGRGLEEETLSGATMRLRLVPTIHLSKNIRLRLTVDAFDNYVLGGSPDFAGALRRPDVPLTAFAVTAQPGAFRLQEAYGEWKTPFGVLRAGRQTSHWGLGLLAHGGAGSTWDAGRPISHYYGGGLLPHQGYGYDADFGTFSDRVAFVTRVAGVYVALFHDWVSEGALAWDPTRVDGVPFDMTQSDDVGQFGIALFQKPLTPKQIAARKAGLVDQHGSSLDWGVYAIYRSQNLDTELYTDDNGDVVVPADMDASDASKLKLMPREAWAAAGDLWVRYENRLSFDQRLVVEGEFVYLTGKIGDASPIPTAGATKERKINMWGGAIKAAFQNEGLGLYLDVGAASGDHNRCFGVYKLPNCSLEDNNGNPDTEITAFKFHRNYRVDSILFRDVIGTVTNAWYVKPTVSINAHPFYALSDRLGVDVSLLHAGALNKDGTPGYGSTLGTELEARAFIGQRDLFHASLSFAYMIPGDALDVLGPNADRDGNCGVASDQGDGCRWEKAVESQEATNVWRLMARLALMF